MVLLLVCVVVEAGALDGRNDGAFSSMGARCLLERDPRPRGREDMRSDSV